MDKKFKILLLGILIGAFGVLIILFIIGCQTKTDPLSKATFPCECIYISETSNAVKFKCQDREEPYHFISEDYNRKCKEGDILNKPLNK